MENKITPNKPFFIIQWHITGLCDQSCLHCYMVNDPESHKRELCNELSFSECLAVIDSLVEFCKTANARPSINFTGGDPLLRPDFFEILAYASERQVRLAIMGNPFHLTGDSILKMKELNVRSYQVSLDGMESIHDSLRKPGSFQATVEALKRLNEYDLRSVVMFTLSRKNQSDLFDVMRLVDELNVNAFAFARISRNPIIDTKIQPAESDFTPEEYRDFLLKAQQLIEELKAGGSQTRFTLKDHLWKLLLYEQGKFKLGENPKNQVISGCHIGSRDLAILADGTVFACRRFNSPIGKVPNQSVLDIFISKELDQYRDVEKFEKCCQCPLLRHCRGCPAVAYGCSNSNFYAPDPQCWWSLTDNNSEQIRGGEHHE